MTARRRVFDFFVVGLATCGYLTYIPAALRAKDSRATGAGIVGTLAGLLTVSWLPPSGLKTAVMLVGAFCVSVVVSDVAEARLQRTDDPRIVIDEWLGFWVSIAWLPRTPLSLAAGFVLFRIFDVLKSAPVRWVSRWPGGWGVVADDVLAGVFANAVLRMITAIHPL